MDKFILAIETSIKEGSLALLNAADVIDEWTGNNAVSRSQDLLVQISQLLKNNQVELKQISKIAVSIGPGSFTGIRVGMATAQGLALALGCELVGISMFEALASDNQIAPDDEFMIIVSAGRDLYFWQVYSKEGIFMPPAAGNADLLNAELEKREIKKILAEQKAYENLKRNDFASAPQRLEIPGSYAALIGRRALTRKSGSNQIAPLYVRPALLNK